MGNDQSRDWEEILDTDKPISRRQYRMIKAICGNEHLIRAESVAREIIGNDLLELDQIEAHEVIQYLEKNYRNKGSFSFEDLDRELGMALINFDPQRAMMSTDLRVLCLLAMNRVATPGQVARFAFGLSPATYNTIRGWAKQVVERLFKQDLIGCERDVALAVKGKSVKTDIYYLTEFGSDELHLVAPSINYYARPGLPRRDRIYHELCVLAARLDLQSDNNLECYEPETHILSEQQKMRNREYLTGERAQGKSVLRGGCGDFRMRVVDPLTGKRRNVEVEVMVRGRGEEISAKPNRITDYYAASLHQCFLIELHQHKFARLVPNIMEPFTDAEKACFAGRPVTLRATVSKERLNKVRAAFEQMGGITTSEAVAAIAGIKNTTASEALALLADQNEIGRCDGFLTTRKNRGRNLRLYFSKGFSIHSVYEFGRLFTASKLISSGILNQEYQQVLHIISFDPATGVMILRAFENDWTVIAIIDDLFEMEERVVNWADAAYREASEIVHKDQFVIATLSDGRAERLRNVSDYKVINVEAVAQTAKVNQRKARVKKKKQRKIRQQPNGDIVSS